MEVRELATGLWRWTAPHPDWTADEGGPDGWEQEVGCVYYDGRNAVVLIDPLVPSDTLERQRFFEYLDRDVERARRPLVVLLTVFWHARSADEIRERYGAAVWAHERSLDRLGCKTTNAFRLGDVLPCGVKAIDASRRDEVLYWLPMERALVAGDVLLGDREGGIRLCPDSWLPEGVSPADFRDALGALLDLPVEMVLVSHGEPVLTDGRAALEAALAEPSHAR